MWFVFFFFFFFSLLLKYPISTFYFLFCAHIVPMSGQYALAVIADQNICCNLKRSFLVVGYATKNNCGNCKLWIAKKRPCPVAYIRGSISCCWNSVTRHDLKNLPLLRTTFNGHVVSSDVLSVCYLMRFSWRSIGHPEYVEYVYGSCHAFQVIYMRVIWNEKCVFRVCDMRFSGRDRDFTKVSSMTNMLRQKLAPINWQRSVCRFLYPSHRKITCHR